MSYINSGSIPQWTKVTKLFSDFSTAGLTNSISIYTLPAKGIVHAVQMVINTAFSGGIIATYTISVGISGTLAKYAVATNVFTAAPLPVISVLPFIESASATTDIKATAISTVGNLNVAVAGSVDIYILTSTLP